MEILQSYWIWILVGIGVVWFLARRGGYGMGCGMGGHEGHRSPEQEERLSGRASAGGPSEHSGHASRGPAPPRRHGGC